MRWETTEADADHKRVRANYDFDVSEFQAGPSARRWVSHVTWKGTGGTTAYFHVGLLHERSDDRGEVDSAVLLEAEISRLALRIALPPDDAEALADLLKSKAAIARPEGGSTATAVDRRIWESLPTLDRAQLFAQGSGGVPEDVDPRALVGDLLDILRREVRDRLEADQDWIDRVKAIIDVGRGVPPDRPPSP